MKSWTEQGEALAVVFQQCATEPQSSRSGHAENPDGMGYRVLVCIYLFYMSGFCLQFDLKKKFFG